MTFDSYLNWEGPACSTHLTAFVGHRPFLYLEGCLPSATFALRLCNNRGRSCPCSALSQFSAKLGMVLLRWDSPCQAPPQRQVLSCCLSLQHQGRIVNYDSWLFQLNPFQTLLLFQFLLLCLSGSIAKKSSPGPSYRLLLLI